MSWKPWTARHASTSAGPARCCCRMCSWSGAARTRSWGRQDICALVVVHLRAGDIEPRGPASPGCRMLVRSLESLHQVPGWVWASLMLASEEGRHRAVALLDGVIRAMAD